MQSLSPIVGVLIGAAIVGAAWMVMSAGPSAPQEPDEVSDLSGSAAQLEVLDRLDRIEERLDAIAVQMNARPAPTEGPSLEGRTEISIPSADPSVPDGPPTDVAISDEVIEKTLERIEARKYAGLSDKALRAEARRLITRERDLPGAKRALEQLLERELEPMERAEAMIDLGSVHRSLEDHETSEKVLRDAMRLATDETEQGIKAGYHLVWTLKQAGREPEALRIADDLTDAPGMNDQMRPWMRWAAARMAYDTGDHDRANADFQALLDELKGKKQYEQIVRDAYSKLQEGN